MTKETVDKIVWWIPIKTLRNNVRELLLLIVKTYENSEITRNKVNEHLFGNFAYSYSQYEQDKKVFYHLNGKKDGFFVDIGAHDGIALSNTFAFEQLGWKGICVEANPDTFEKLKKNRTCDSYNYAVTSIKDEYIEFRQAGVLGVIESLSSSSHKKRIKKESGDTDLVKVKTSTFDNLMKNYPSITYIDYLSLDVEGSEMDVLKTIDFSKYKFGILTVENNAGPNEIKDFMEPRGYNLIEHVACDLLFMPK